MCISRFHGYSNPDKFIKNGYKLPPKVWKHAYGEFFKEDIEIHNQKQIDSGHPERANLTIDNIYDEDFKKVINNPKAKIKSPMRGILIQFGGEHDNINLQDPNFRERQRKALEATYKKITEMIPEKYIFQATIHMDETTPHMHLIILPIHQQSASRNRPHIPSWEAFLKKEIGLKSEKSMIPDKNGEYKEGENVQNAFRNLVIRTMDEVGSQYGFQREDKHTVEYRNQEEYIKNDNLQKENKKIENKIKDEKEILEITQKSNEEEWIKNNELAEKNKKLENEIELKKEEAFKNVEKDIKKEIGKNKIKQEMTPQPKPVVEEKGFGKNKKEVVDKKDYDNLEKLRKLDQQNNQHLLDQEEVYRLQLFDKDKKISELKEKDSIKKYEELEKKYKNSEEEKQVLKEELQQSKQQQQQTEQDLQKEVEKNKYFKNENEEIKEENKTLKNKLQNMSETIKSGWSKATALLELVLKNLSKLLQKFPQLHQQSEIQSIDKEFAKFENNKDVQMLNRVTDNNHQKQDEATEEI